MPHRHLHRGEPAPGNSEHADVTVRPGLACEPRDHLLPVDLFLFGIFALWRRAFACAESSNIDTHAHIAAPREVRVLGIVSGGRPIILAIWQIFEQGGKLVTRLRAVRHVESRGQAHAILQRNPRLLHSDSVRRRRRRFGGERERNRKRNEAASPDCFRQRGSVLPGAPFPARFLREKWGSCLLTQSQSADSCSRRMARRSIPSCSAFLYRWLRSRPSALAATLMF